MSRKGLREALFVVVFVVTVIGCLAGIVLVAGIGTYSITSIGVRWLALVAMLVASTITVLRIAGLIPTRDPEMQRWFAWGVLTGGATMLVLAVPLLLEVVNGAFDNSARPVSVRVHSAGSVAGLGSLVVDNWVRPGERRTVFWSDRTTVDLRENDCLFATVGDGLFGLSWIGRDRRIEPCEGAGSSPTP
jgi:hypothetical protein